MTAPTHPITPFDELAETCTALLDAYIQWARQRGLSANEFFVLYMLGQGGACSAKEIGEHWLLPKQTVSFVCRQLQDKGWLLAETDPRDKRGKQLRLSAEGQAVALPLVAELTRLEAQTADAFGAARLTRLLRDLRHLHTLFAAQLALPPASDEEPGDTEESHAS